MVVLGYMKSCWRETITGIGTVVVGNSREPVHLSESRPRSALRFRARRSGSTRKSARAPRRWCEAWRKVRLRRSLRSTAFRRSSQTSGRGKLVVERLDVKGERYDVDLTAASARAWQVLRFCQDRHGSEAGRAYMPHVWDRSTSLLGRSQAPSPARPRSSAVW